MEICGQCFIYLLLLLFNGKGFICNKCQACFLIMHTTFKENIIVKENDVVNFTFSLNDTSCWTGESIRIEVYRNGPHECILSQFGNVCKRSSSTTTCSCVQDGLYLFHKEMTKNDSGNWTWNVWNVKEGHKITMEPITMELIVFNIQYQANVVEMKVDGHVVHSSYAMVTNRNAIIVCIWENGNPPVTARLLGNSGEILGNETYQNLTYIYKASNCNNITIVSCEAGGSRRNLSISLLTICSPVFIDASSRYDLTTEAISLRVRAYTTNITQCNLYKLQESIDASEIEDGCHPVSKTIVDNVTCQIGSTTATFYVDSCLDTNLQGKHCSCGLEGTVPDLNFTLQLHNFTERDNGEWMIAVHNLGGCNTTTITLTVYGKERVTVISTTAGTQTINVTMVMAAIMGSLVLIVVFTIVIFAPKKKDNKEQWKHDSMNDSFHRESPTDYPIHLTRLQHGGMVNGVLESPEELISPVALTRNDGMDGSEGIVDKSNIYSRVVKKPQDRLDDIGLKTEAEDIQAYTNPFYGVVSAKKDVETQNALRDKVQEVLEYANPFYEIINRNPNNMEIRFEPNENGSSPVRLKDEHVNCGADVAVITDSNNQSEDSDDCSQPPMLHILSLAEARQNNYVDVSFERRDTGVFPKPEPNHHVAWRRIEEPV